MCPVGVFAISSALSADKGRFLESELLVLLCLMNLEPLA